MGRPGTRTLSLRGPEGWKGMTTQTAGERGDSRFNLIENGYVSSDGNEIRMMPGYKCVVDLRSAALIPNNQDNDLGFARGITDAVRPAAVLTGSYYETAISGFVDAITVYTKPTHIHGFKIVRGRVILYGESDLRREIIHANGVTTRISLISFTTGVDTVLTVSQAVDVTVLFNSLSDNATNALRYVFIEGTGEPLLDNVVHQVKAVAGATITIETDTSATTGRTNLQAEINRVRRGLAGVGSYTIGQPYYQTDPSFGSDDPECLTTWQVVGLPFVTPSATSALVTTCYPAYVANRQRDFGDASGTRYEGVAQQDQSRRRQRPIPFRLVPDVSSDRLLLAAPGYGCVFQMPLMNPIDPTEVGGAVGLPFRTNDIFDKPRCVGVPQAYQWEDSDKTSTSAHFDFTVTGQPDTPHSYGSQSGGNLGRNGIYNFKICFRDDATGEVGLPSDPLTLTTAGGLGSGGNDIRINLFFLHPGYVMAESLAFSVLVFRTQKDQGENGTYFHFATAELTRDVVPATVTSAKYGLTPSAVAVIPTFLVGYRVTYVSEADLIKNTYALPIIESMPRGAKAVRTVRARTFYGGQRGNAGNNKELIAGTLTTQYDVNGKYQFPTQIAFRMAAGVGVTPIDSVWGCAQGSLPSSYSGVRSYISSIRGFPYPRQSVNVKQLKNTVATVGAGFQTEEHWWPRFEVQPAIANAGVARTTAANTLGVSCWFKLERGSFQVSELTAPGVVNGSIGYIDAQGDDDIEGIGSFSGGTLIFSRQNTYLLNWALSPITNGIADQPQQMVSNFGCIGSNTVTEYEGGCVQISEQGPSAFGLMGSQWIGRDLERYFIGDTSRYKRDSEGMMRCAFSCHDTERGLVYFGVFADRNFVETPAAPRVFITYRGDHAFWDVTINARTGAVTTTTDEARSRFPCDEVLIWSYRTGAWSVWVPKPGMEVLWMESVTDGDGQNRIMFLARDWRIYAFDETFGDANVDLLTFVPAAAGTGATVVTFTDSYGVGSQALGASDNYLRVGMTVLLVDQTTRKMLGLTTIAAVASTIASNPTSITLATAMSWTTKTLFLIGVKTMTLRSNNVQPANTGDRVKATSIGLRYSLKERGRTFLRSPPTLSGLLDMFVKVRVLSARNDPVTGVTSDVVGVPTDTGDTTAYVPLGSPDQYAENLHVDTRYLPVDPTTSQNFSVEAVFVGFGQIKLLDLSLEVA